MGDGVNMASDLDEQSTAVDVEELSEDQVNAMILERISAEQEGREPTVVLVEEDSIQENEDEAVEETDEQEEKTETVEESEEDVEPEEDEVAKLRRQVAEKEAIFKTHTEEVGVSRKRISELEAALAAASTQSQQTALPADVLGDEYDGIDVAAVDKIVQARLRQAQEAQTKYYAQQNATRTQNEQALKASIPDFDSLIPDIASILTRDGQTDPQAVAQFRADPYQFDPNTVYAYAQRAKAERELVSLKAERDKLKERPAKLVKKIKKVSGKTKSIDEAGASTGDPSPKLTMEAIEHLSPTQVTELLAKRIREELRKKTG
jgi:hypothetical protein